MDIKLVACVLLAFILNTSRGFSSSGVPCYLLPSGDKCHYSQKPDSPACTSTKTRSHLENGVKQLNRSMFSLEQQLIGMGVIPPDNACSELPPLNNGGVVYSDLNLAPGSVGKYICNEGFFLQALYGRREFNCTEYGVWDGNVTTTPVTCVLMVEKCDPPNEILNGSVLFVENDKERLLPGDMVTYTCEEGYELTGDENRFCLRTGNWSGQDPQCLWKEPEPESQAADNQAMVAGVSVISVLLFFAVVVIVVLGAVIAVIKYGLPLKGRSSDSERLVVSHEEVDQSPTHRAQISDYSHIDSPVKSKNKLPFAKPGKAKKLYNKDFTDSTC